MTLYEINFKMEVLQVTPFDCGIFIIILLCVEKGS